MTDVPDARLLEQFARNGSEEAFAALVQRHIALVHSVALRHTANAQHAQDITQAVFVILARKVGALGRKTVLPGWLYHTARLTAANLQRAETRRVCREQEAFMQSKLEESPTDNLWRELSPQLDEAMAGLGTSERDALVLRYFQNKSMAEVAKFLGLEENTAQKRVSRALEKLRKFFTKRGVDSTAAGIAENISAHSVQAVPAALAKSVTAVALAKGAAASTSTLTLVKGALKIMAWTKAKTAIVVGVGVLLAVGTTTVTVKEIQAHRTYSWQLPNFKYKADNSHVVAPSVIEKTPPQVRIVPTIHPRGVNGFPFSVGDSVERIGGKMLVHTNQSKSIGLGATLDQIIQTAYGSEGRITIYLTQLPTGRYDYIANLPHGAFQALQELIKKKFGLVGRWQPVETNVLLLKLANPDDRAFKPAGSLMRSMNVTNIEPDFASYFGGADVGDAHFYQTMARFIEGLESTFQLPIVDDTGITNEFDCIYKAPQSNRSWTGNPDALQKATRDALYNQLGLELVPGTAPVKMLVVEKAK